MFRRKRHDTSKQIAVVVPSTGNAPITAPSARLTAISLGDEPWRSSRTTGSTKRRRTHDRDDGAADSDSGELPTIQQTSWIELGAQFAQPFERHAVYTTHRRLVELMPAIKIWPA